MKRTVCFLLMLTVLFTLVSFAHAEAQPQMLTDENGVQLGFIECKGRQLSVSFNECAENSYGWKTPDDQELLSLTEENVIEANEYEKMLGLPGKHVFNFNTIKTGRGMLTFWFASNWIHGENAVYAVNILYSVENDMSVTVAGAFAAHDEPIPDTIEEQMFSDPQYGSITFKKSLYQIYVGRSTTVAVNASSRDVSKKGYTFESSDTSIATVNSEGSVKGISQGTCTILVRSKNDDRVWARFPVQVMVKVTKVTVSAETTTLTVGSQTQLRAEFEPVNADNKELTWRSSDKSIATVDANGVVTAVGKGEVTITAVSKDVDEKSGRVKLTVTQSVSGVTIDKQYVRVGVRYTTDVTATIKPSNANNKNMTWYSSDESVATVSGKRNECTVKGVKWGQATITGVTEDGGYSVSFTALVGSLNRAVRITDERITAYGQPVFTLVNDSNMNISSVHVAIRGYDYYGNPVQLSYGQDPYTLTGDYNYNLAPGALASSYDMQYRYLIGWNGVSYIEAAITGWECDEGYLTTKGEISNHYGLGDSTMIWVNMGTMLPTNAPQGE